MTATNTNRVHIRFTNYKVTANTYTKLTGNITQESIRVKVVQRVYTTQINWFKECIACLVHLLGFIYSGAAGLVCLR